MASTSFSCMSIAATPTPSESILDVLMNKKKTVFLNLSKMQLLGQYDNITLQ